MINNYLERQIKENFPYQPTLEQEIAVKSLSEFLLSTLADEVLSSEAMPVLVKHLW
jgi:hypothetical protein